MDLHVVDHLLTTTRAVRKRLDLGRPVPDEVVTECLRIAIQAPTASNTQSWRWVVVTDPDKRAALADLYRSVFDVFYGDQPGADLTPQMTRVRESSMFLSQHLGDVPVHVIPCIEGRPVPGGDVFAGASLFGSIFPAVWSFQLALRSRGLGSVLTTLHLPREREAAELLGIPDDVSQVGLIPVAYFTGSDFRPAARRPVEELTYWNTWEQTHVG